MDPSANATPDLTREEGDVYMEGFINENAQANYIDEMCEKEDEEVEGPDEPHIDDMPLFMDEQIGRASCRERVLRLV